MVRESLPIESLLFIYVSETGTAQDCAESLWRDARLRSIPSRLVDIDDFDIESLLEEKFVVFVVATSGQGEMPVAMKTAWSQLLRRGLPADLLEDLSVAVFGLGDSSYQKFNFAAKKLFRRLEQLGAKTVLPLGLADDQHDLGVDGALDPWRTLLWKTIQEGGYFPTMKPDFNPSQLLPPKYEIRYCDESTSGATAATTNSTGFVQLDVIENKRVTAEDHFQDTRLVTFDNGAGALEYNPGDVLMVHPENPTETVDLALELVPTDQNIQPPPSWLIGSVTTLRTCFKRLFDLQTIPKRSFLKMLAQLSSVEMEKEKLLEFASAEGLDDYLDYCYRPRRTIAELLRDFGPSVKNLPLERLFDLFASIRPRAFSIASCPVTHKGTIQILVGKVEYKVKKMAAVRRGLCSTYLARLSVGDRAFLKIRRGTFRWPSMERPILLVGPGTGVAPFRSILSYRGQEDAATHSVLFFGCRNSSKDFYFSDEWERIANASVFCAFSRDDPKRKVYVQHVMAEKALEVARILEENGSIFVAGSSGKMPEDVADCIAQIAEKHGGVPDGKVFVEKLEKCGRLQFETWS
ncbi:hypothetical protein QR680_006249 [Steinernema hermaphroditum]|uniref:NADPH-dependent diflavin oxidoreductase 1 n=1 Tax=Steinernema hermaphroditum TaxID=289476 RepID=A0AA39LX36_9BILA|nr:hypothetical protein QR680_006249 [Steinernema hermaphroditum]